MIESPSRKSIPSPGVSVCGIVIEPMVVPLCSGAEPSPYWDVTSVTKLERSAVVPDSARPDRSRMGWSHYACLRKDPR